jgi:hypothetical protein
MSNHLAATSCVIVIILAGCATAYSPPTGVPTATLILSGSPVATSNGVAALGGNTAFSLVGNPTACTGVVDIAHGLKDGKSESVLVGSGKPTVIKFLYAQVLPLAFCEGFIQFLPEEGATYSLRLDEGYFSQGKCMPNLQKKSADGKQFTNVLFRSACENRK